MTILDSPKSRSLTTDPLFVTYWISETLNDLSESVAVLALSLTAVVILAADPFQMGVLGAARTLPYMGLGLLAGVVVDRTRRRPVMFAAGLLSGTLLLLVPLTAFAGVLRVELLYLVAFGTGALTLVGNVAHRAFLPVFVGRSRLVPANSLLHLSGAAAQIAGPTAAGFLIQLVTAPLALVVSAVAAIASALMLVYVRVIEPRPAGGMRRREVLDEMREGLWIVLGDPQLRAIMLTGTTHNFFSNGMLVTLYVLFASEHLRLSAAEIGLVFAVGGPGSIVGATLAARLSRAFGLRLTIGGMQILTGVARLAMPIAALVGPTMLVLAVGEFLLGFARSVFNINQISLRQSVTADHQQGRMTASIGFLMWAAVPLGALLAGWLATRIGVLPTIGVAVAGTFAAALWVFLLPVRWPRLDTSEHRT